MGERLSYKQDVTGSNPVLVMPGVQFFICITFRLNNLNKIVKSYVIQKGYLTTLSPQLLG